MTKKERTQLIQALVSDIWSTDWFANEYTHGCYAEEDFLGDLNNLSDQCLINLRKHQVDNLDADVFYEKVWTGENIEYPVQAD
jgi:hypothetical protein